MKKANDPIQETAQSDQSDLKGDQSPPTISGGPQETAEVHEVVEGYKLIISQAQTDEGNPLNPCSKLPAQIRREQFISICADIWRRHLAMAVKEREIVEE